MPDRSFPYHTVPIEGRPTSAMRIECADCSATADFLQTHNGRRPPKAAEQYFRAKGWSVGNGPRRDLCPVCIEKKATHAAVKDMPMKPQSMPSQMAPIINGQPREMTRQDRVLIHAEIKGCWDDDRKCYMDGWHDERVAKALGVHVPKAWVSEVREDFFGKVNTNQEIDLYLTQLGEATDQQEQVKKLAARITAEIEAVQKRLDPLIRLGKDVQKSIR